MFQFLFSIPIMIPAALAGSPAVQPSELPANLWNGLRCYVGLATVRCDDDADGDCHADHCYSDGPVRSKSLGFTVSQSALVCFLLE